MSRFLVVAAGPTEGVSSYRLETDTVVIAADGGADRARAAGWPVHHLVGDLDSVTEAGEAHADGHGATIRRHPVDKDATDLELALDLAVASGASRIDVVLDGAGRLDHLLVSTHVLASEAYAAVPIRAMVGEAVVTVVRQIGEVRGAAGDIVTLLPIGGPARVSTRGLRFALDDEWLSATSGRGVSNRLLVDAATIEVPEGVVLVIQPPAE